MKLRRAKPTKPSTPHPEFVEGALVVPLTGPAEPVGKKVMRLKLGEHPRAPACAIAQDARDRERGVVIENRQRHAVEEGECRIVTVAERLGRLRRIGLDEARIAVRQIQGKEVNLPGDPADHRPGFTEVHLGHGPARDRGE